MNRKQFIYTLGGTMSASLLSSVVIGQPEPKPMALPAEKVKEFVGVCHADLDKVKALLTEIPNLIYCSWDWGGGDFESGSRQPVMSVGKILLPICWAKEPEVIYS